MYILDEPSIGLHQRDNQRLLDTLHRLRDLGNTVIVVEHDEDAIRQADHVVDLGPGRAYGGRVVAQGTPAQIEASPASLTGQYLSGRKRIEIPEKRRKSEPKQQPMLRQASGNNLKRIDVSFPVGLLTCVTGVSGSGKSTLVNDTLFRVAARSLGLAADQPASAGVEGLEAIDRVIDIDQSPIGRTPRSNPATYTGLFTRFANFSPAPPNRARAATSRAASASTSRAVAARPARATASSRSRCTSCRTCTSPATSAKAGATTARRSTSTTRARTSTSPRHDRRGWRRSSRPCPSSRASSRRCSTSGSRT
jgi:excinuclease ABC subunit A